MKGCVMIHQRQCTHLGVTMSFTANRTEDVYPSQALMRRSREENERAKKQARLGAAARATVNAALYLEARLQWMAGHYHDAHMHNTRKKKKSGKVIAAF
jgi:hypothetical protein